MENNFSYSQYSNEMIKYEINKLSDTTLNRESYTYYKQNLNLEDIKYAIYYAEQNNDIERKELFEQLYEKAERMMASLNIFSKRYAGIAQNEAIRRTDEDLLEIIDNVMSDLGQEAYAGFSTVQNIYTYLTNAKDNTDLLKRLEVVSQRIEKYKEVLKETYNIDITNKIDAAVKDFESGDILGLHKDDPNKGRD